ncbi:MAG: hypothetical protein AAFY73_12795 [Pseudomonadota bacterium]
MIKQYGRFIGRELYKQAYGLNCPLVLLTVSTSNWYVNQALKILDEELRANRSLAFATAPDFATPFQVPTQILPLANGWVRSGSTDFTLIPDLAQKVQAQASNVSLKPQK